MCFLLTLIVATEAALLGSLNSLFANCTRLSRVILAYVLAIAMRLH